MPNAQQAVFECPRFSVLRRTSPRTGRRTWWVQLPDVVSIVAIGSDGRILVIDEYRPEDQRSYLGIPAGGVLPGEALKDAARRELREETGYDAANLHRVHVYTGGSSLLRQKVHVFRANNLGKNPLEAEDTKHCRPFFMTLSRFQTKVRSGQVSGITTRVLPRLF